MREHPETVITSSDVAKLIAALEPPVGAESLHQVREVIDSTARLVKEMNQQRWFEELEGAQAEQAQAELRVAATQQHLTDASVELRQTEPVSALKMLVFFASWAVCVAGEFAITLSTIPFVLDLPEDGALAMAVSAVPVAALTVLEWAIARSLEDPYQATVRAITVLSRWPRRAVYALMTAFLCGLLAGNIYTIKLLASAREESAALRQNLQREDGDTEVAVNHQAISQAILAVSIVVAVDGALLFLVILRDMQNGSRRVRARARIWFHSPRLSTREKARLDAVAAVHSRQRVWEQRAERADAIVDEFRARHLFSLQQVLDRVPRQPPQTLQDRVTEALARTARPVPGESGREATC